MKKPKEQLEHWLHWTSSEGNLRPGYAWDYDPATKTWAFLDLTREPPKVLERYFIKVKKI